MKKTLGGSGGLIFLAFACAAGVSWLSGSKASAFAPTETRVAGVETVYDLPYGSRLSVVRPLEIRNGLASIGSAKVDGDRERGCFITFIDGNAPSPLPVGEGVFEAQELRRNGAILIRHLPSGAVAYLMCQVRRPEQDGAPGETEMWAPKIEDFNRLEGPVRIPPNLIVRPR